MSALNDVLTTEKAAEYLGLKPSTLVGWRTAGKGPTYIKVGRHCLYRLADIETWLDAQAVIPFKELARQTPTGDAA